MFLPSQLLKLIFIIMRHILPFLLLFVASCSGKQSAEQQSQNDTAKLFDPSPRTDEIGASEMNIFKRNIILTEPGYTIVFNDKENKLKTLDKVKEFIESNKTEIQKKKFYIITDSSTSFEKIFTVINILKEHQIPDYKVINTDQYLTPIESKVVQAPPVVETSSKLNDSSFLYIDLLRSSIQVKLKGKESKLKNTADLEEYIATHKQEIKEAIISVEKGLTGSTFKEVLEILYKLEIYKILTVQK